MNVLIIGGNSGKKMGGIETYVRTLTQNISATFHHVTTFGSSDMFDVHKLDSLNVTESECNVPRSKNKIIMMFLLIFYRMKLSIHLRKNANKKFDRVILNIAPWYVPKKYVKNSIIVMHVEPTVFLPKSKISKLYFCLTLQFRKFKLCDKIVVYTKYDIDEFPNSLKSKCFPIPLAANMKQRSKKVVDPKKIGWVGRLDNDAKDVNFLNSLASSLKDWHFIVAGSGDHKLCSEIDYRGPLSFSELTKFYEEIDVLISTSNTEGFGYVFCEALMNGIPLILPNTFPSSQYFADDYNVAIVVEKNISDYEKAFRMLSKKIKKEDIINFNKSHNINSFILKWEEII